MRETTSRIALVEPTPTPPPIKFVHRPYVPLVLLCVAAPLLCEGCDVRLLDSKVYHLNKFLEIPTSRGRRHRCGFRYNLQHNKRTWRPKGSLV